MTVPTDVPARRTARGLALLLVTAFCVANAVNAVHKGGDFQGFLEAGRRVLTGAPLYAGSGPGIGVTWPPFLAMFFAPLAAVDAYNQLAARLIWYAIGLLCLWFALQFWTRAYYGDGPEARAPVVRSELVVPLLCILFPLQTNFEHQNLNPLLLFLLGWSTLAVLRHRHISGGVVLGTAVALKAFPALLVVYLAYRRLWQAAVAAVVTAVVLTVLPTLRYGRDAFAQFANWWSISDGGWPTRGNNQSLVAAVDRMVTGFENPHVAMEGDGLTVAIVGLIALALVFLLVTSTRQPPYERHVAAREMAAVTTLAVLLSPIAWDHYWVLLFPAFLVAYQETKGHPRGAMAFWTAAFLTSALTPLTLGESLFDAVRERSPQTAAALILFVLLMVLARRAQGASAGATRSS